MKNILRQVGLLFAGLLTIVGIAFIVTPAQAAPSPPYFYDECNSAASVTLTRNYHANYNFNIGFTLDPGECRNQLPNPEMIWVNDVRVDVDPEAFSGNAPDVDSYVPGHINYGYADCRNNNENNAADPYNDWADTGYRYRNYTDDNCNGNYQ